MGRGGKENTPHAIIRHVFLTKFPTVLSASILCQLVNAVQLDSQLFDEMNIDML